MQRHHLASLVALGGLATASACVGDYRLQRLERLQPDAALLPEAGAAPSEPPDAGAADADLPPPLPDTHQPGTDPPDGADAPPNPDPPDGGDEPPDAAPPLEDPPPRCASLRRLGPLSYASGVSADGAFVVGNVDELAYRWSSLDLADDVPLGLLPGSLDSATGTFAAAASSDGRFVVGSSFFSLDGSGGQLRAFRWGELIGMNDMGDLPGVAALSVQTSALGVSADGSVVVGGMSDGTRQRAFRWDQAQSGVQDLGDLPELADPQSGAFNEARGTSADGSVVVGLVIGPSGNHAFRWGLDTGVMEDLGGLPNADRPSYGSAANAVSGDGLVIVGAADIEQGQVGFR